MQRIRLSQLVAGRAYSGHLFTVTGQKLLASGVTLNERHLQAIRRCGEVEVLVAEGVEELVAEGILTKLEQPSLAVGQRLGGSLVTHTGQVLVEPGEQIEAHHLDALAAAGGARQALVAPKPKSEQRRARILLSDALVEDLQAEAAKVELRVAPETIAPSASVAKCEDPATWPAPMELADERAEAVESLRRCFARIEAGVNVPLRVFDPVVDHLLERLTTHPKRFTQLALLCPRQEDYLPDHAYTVTCLSMAIAVRLNWPSAHVRALGLAGLLFDLGMLLVPEPIRTGVGPLNDIDRSRVQRHPIFTLAMMQSLDQVPLAVRLAAMQHHERENGSGYPEGQRRDSIGDYARVLAVADCYAATTEPRAYRKPKLPYIAMEETLRAASMMVLWKPAVRALIQAAGLFPVGSFLKLSNGQTATVIAANPTQLDRPVVQPVAPSGVLRNAPVDLATLSLGQLAVVRPLASAAG